jgi:hypothetical protein
MVKSLLINNMEELNKKLNTPINYLDIDYNAISPDPGTTQGKTKTRTRILHNDYAILNAYRMWLQSRRYDYIRAPNFGGMFDSALNDKFPFKTESEGIVADYIKSETETHWPQITVLNIEVKAELAKKNWLIKILAQDKQSGLVLQDLISRGTE